MGNRIGKIGFCFTGADPTRNPDLDFYPPDPYDESLGHSFCYVRPDPTRFPVSSKIHSEESTGVSSIFRSISGAAVSANTSTNPLSTTFVDPTFPGHSISGPLFESSLSFASGPLQPIPRSGPISGSGPISDLGFLSGPISDRGFLSGPLDRAGTTFSGPLDRSFSHGGGKWAGLKPKKRGGSLIRGLNWVFGGGSNNDNMKSKKSKDCVETQGSLNLDEMENWESNNLEWAQGRAGEDRVHVVVSEEHGWVFVGIYDGFNGPDATDFLLSNLYCFVQKEVKGLLWDDDCAKLDSFSSSFDSLTSNLTNSGSIDSRSSCSSCSDMEGFVGTSCDVSDPERESNGSRKKGRKWRSKHGHGGVAKKWGENQRKWKCEWDRERLELDRRLKEQWNGNESRAKAINHTDVLKALAQALQKTEEAYLDIADKMVDENPELALMGSCVLAMLMKGEDVYVVNVGDSRAVLAQNKEPDLRLGKIDQDLERINEESMYDFQVPDGVKPSLRSVQLTMDHSTSVEEEVQRIRGEHPDDAFSVVNDRVKGSLKVTRAFGAGFLKQPKWNEALLEMFRIDYVGTSPYINCLPSLCHHRLGPKDQFLLLSSDGLYQYFTNEEAVAEVELFISLSPEGDPAQHLVEEVLLRAAKKAGMDFYDLLEIPPGDRRKYHDDVSIIIISLEGRIWRSCV